MSTLAQKHCVACTAGTPPLDDDHVQRMLSEIPGWEVRNGLLTRDLTRKNFREAVALVNQIAEVAEEENHHPDLTIHGWNKVCIELLTHSIGGLSENDFILAGKITELLDRSPAAG